MKTDEDDRCPECHGDDLEVIGIREVHAPSRGSESSREANPIVAHRIDFRCRACGCDGSVLRRLQSGSRTEPGAAADPARRIGFW